MPSNTRAAALEHPRVAFLSKELMAKEYGAPFRLPSWVTPHLKSLQSTGITVVDVLPTCASLIKNSVPASLPPPIQGLPASLAQGKPFFSLLLAPH